MKGTLKLAVGGVLVIAVGRMAATGRLPRNLFAGIRIPSTLRSDEAWRAGHRAAASALTVAGCGPLVVAAIEGVTHPDRHVQQVLSRIATVWLLGWLGFATAQASSAARAVESG